MFIATDHNKLDLRAGMKLSVWRRVLSGDLFVDRGRSFLKGAKIPHQFLGSRTTNHRDSPHAAPLSSHLVFFPCKADSVVRKAMRSREGCHCCTVARCLYYVCLPVLKLLLVPLSTIVAKRVGYTIIHTILVLCIFIFTLKRARSWKRHKSSLSARSQAEVAQNNEQLTKSDPYLQIHRGTGVEECIHWRHLNIPIC